MAAKFAVSLMALLGAVSAQTGYTNSSSIATTTSSSASATFSNGAMVTAAGVVYTIMDDTTYSDVTPLQLSRKRQASSGIGSCLNTCSDNAQCAGASYSDDTMRCSYYSSINQDSEASSPGTDFAIVESRPKASSSANSTTSATGSATAPGVSGSSNSTRSATSSRPAGITGGAGNSTSSRPTGSASRTSSSTGSSTPVPSSPSTIITIRGVSFLLEIDINYSGITIDFTILSKRAGQSLDDCLNTCAANSNCAGTSFEESTGTCTFFTSIDSGSRTPTNGVDFATVLSRANANNGSGSGNNGTSGAGNSTSPATNATAESFICPKLNGGVLVSNLEITFAISCSEFLIGTTFDLLSTVSTKRQAVENGLPQTLSNCVDLCSLSAECVGTTFSEATGCSYYSDVRYATPMDGFDSAVKVQDNSGNGVTTTTVIAGQTVTTTVAAGTTTQYVGAASTATVYVTSVSTVTSYVGGATGLPSGATVTQIVPVSTITYNPSVSTITLPQNYAGQTVTVTQGAGAAAPTVTESVTVTVDQNGNVVGESTNVAGAAGGAGSYPTVTVHDLYCPTSTAPSVVWTTVFVR